MAAEIPAANAAASTAIGFTFDDEVTGLRYRRGARGKREARFHRLLMRLLGPYVIVPSVRRLLVLPGLLAACLAASTANAATPTLETPDVRAVARLSPSFVDSVLSSTSPQAADVRARTSEWGGPTVATDGETVTIYFSDSYPADPVLQKKWADFMTSLVHGPELSTVSIHLAPLAEVQRYCGSQALACYSGRTRTIYSPGEGPDADTSAEGALAHEYGHHVAGSRSNPPFESIDYGTKRWASYENVCSKAASGTLFPGAEDAARYSLNPGEAFAEAYRVLNEQKLGLKQEAWNIVTPTLFPDATALELLEQDVVTPWTAPAAKTLTAALTSKIRTRTFSVATPYDGTIAVAPRQAGKATVSVSLLGAKGATVGTSAFKRASGTSISSTVCGQRSYRVRVTLPGTVTKNTKTTVSLTVTSS